MKRMIIGLLVLTAMTAYCEEPPRSYCDQILDTNRSYQVISDFISSTFYKEKKLYLLRDSESYQWILDEQLEEIEKVLKVHDMDFVLMSNLRSFRRCKYIFENKINSIVNIKIENRGFVPKIVSVKHEFQDLSYTTKQFKNKLLSCSMPIFDSSKRVAFLAFSVQRSPDSTQSGWVLLSYDGEYWSVIYWGIAVIS